MNEEVKTESQIYKERSEQLIERFPQLYIHPRWGKIQFEINNGWFDLILNLSLEIEKCVNSSENKIWPVAMQVKEKFGGLRFYVDNSDDDIDNIIAKYENLSIETCDVCGKTGKRESVNRWLSVRCTEHSESK